MRRLLFILFLLLPLIIVAQAPIWRNSFTTNQAPPVIGTNVGISNTASSFMWKFYGGSDPNRVAVLSDITGGSATNAIGNLNGYGTNTTFFGPLVWGSTNVMDEIAAMIRRSNGFGTNLTLLGDRFSMSTTGLVYTNFAGFYPRVGISTNFPQAILHVNTEYPSMCSLLVASNNWQGVNPTILVTNGFVGIGQHRPISELELKGNEIISGWIRVTNGARFNQGGVSVLGNFTNGGTAYLTNIATVGNQTALAINTNAVDGVAVVQIAAGTNGSTGRAPTNQWVILYTNAIYGKGFAVETNGAVTASSFTGITPGGGAFIANQDGVGTNTILGGDGWTNRLIVTTNQITFTNDGYGTYMRWLSSFGTMKLSGALQASALASDTLLIVTQAGIFYGPVYATGFTNTSAAAIFTDVTPSKIAVFGPDRDLTNSTIDAADLAKIGQTNFNSIFITNSLYASNIVATNFTVDTFISSTLQLSNALEVRFGGTGTNTNVLGAFFIGNGTNPVVFLNTNDYANWLSNQIATAGIGGGTNFSMVRVTNMADVGMALLLRTNALPTPQQVGNSRGMALSVSNVVLGVNTNISELWFLYSTNGTGFHVPMRQDFGGTKFDKQIHTYGGGQFYQTSTTTNDYFFRGALSGASGIYIRPQVATNDGAGGYGGLMDIALRTDVTNYPVINGPTFVGGSTNAGILVVSNSGGTFAVVVTNSATAKGTYIGTNGNIATSGNISTSAGTVSGDTISGGSVSSSTYVMAALNNIFRWGSGTGPSLSSGSQTNSIRLLDSFASGNQISAAVSNGASLLLPPSYSLPNVGTANLTSSVFGAVWAIGNTNGTLAFATSTNGTNLYIVAGLNPTNGLWVSNHVTVLGTNYATAFVGNGSLLTGLPSGSTNFDNISVGTNAYISGIVYLTNHLEVLDPTNNPIIIGGDLSATNLFTNSVNRAQLYMSNNVLFLEIAYPSGSGTAGKRTFTFNTNGTMTAPSSISTLAGTISSGGSLAASGSGFGSIGWSGYSTMRSMTNGTIRFGDAALSTITVSTNGATLLFDPVAILPWSVASLAILTNKQFALANTNGEMRFFTGTNGTSLTDSTMRRSVDVFGINASNIWVQTQQMTNNSANSLGGQPISCYVAMMFSGTNYGQVFGASAYTNIVGFNVWNTNWFVVNTNTGYVTNKFAGYYRCSINLSMLGQNGGIYEGCLLTNDVDSELIGFKHQHDTPARLRSASGLGIIYLPADTGCSFALKSDVPGPIQIHRGSFTIGTP